jgi:formate C-acetyltransferase
MVLAQSDRLSSKIPGIENMLYEYGGDGYPRVSRVRADLMAAVPAICPERALLITESYRETEGSRWCCAAPGRLKKFCRICPFSSRTSS